MPRVTSDDVNPFYVCVCLNDSPVTKAWERTATTSNLSPTPRCERLIPNSSTGAISLTVCLMHIAPLEQDGEKWTEKEKALPTFRG